MFRRKALQGAVPTPAPSGAGAGSFGRLVAQISNSGESQVIPLVPLFLLARLTSACNCSMFPPLPLCSAIVANTTSNSQVFSRVGQTTAADHRQAVLHYHTWQRLCTSWITELAIPVVLLAGALHCCQTACNGIRVRLSTGPPTLSKLAKSFCLSTLQDRQTLMVSHHEEAYRCVTAVL